MVDLHGELPSELGNLKQLEQCSLTLDSQWVNYPENYFDCSFPDTLPTACGGAGGNATHAPDIRCHPPSSSPSPPTYFYG